MNSTKKGVDYQRIQVDPPPTQNDKLLSNPDAEAGLLFALMRDEHGDMLKEATQKLSIRDFTDEVYGKIFRAFQQQFAEDGVAEGEDVLRRVREVERVKNADKVFAHIADKRTTTAHFRVDLNSVLDASERRRLVDVADYVKESTLDGKPIDDILSNVEADADLIRKDRSSQRGRSIKSIGDLWHNHPELNEPIIDGLIRRGETANIIGSSKEGKSFMTYGIAYAVANGKPWLGFETNQSRVLIVDNELHEPTLAHRLKVVCSELGLDPKQQSKLIDYRSLRGKLRGLHTLANELKLEASPGEYGLIILDAKYRFTEKGEEENSNSDQTRLYNEIDSLAADLDSAIILVHHNNKGSQGDKKVTDLGAGAGAQSRAADCHLAIREHEQEGASVLEAAVRSFAKPTKRGVRYEYPLWYLDDSFDLESLEGCKSAQEERTNKQDILRMARIREEMEKPGANEWWSRRMIREESEISDSVLKRVLPKMVNQSQLKKRDAILGGKETHEYKILPQAGAELAKKCSGRGGSPTQLPLTH